MTLLSLKSGEIWRRTDNRAFELNCLQQLKLYIWDEVGVALLKCLWNSSTIRSNIWVCVCCESEASLLKKQFTACSWCQTHILAVEVRLENGSPSSCSRSLHTCRCQYAAVWLNGTTVESEYILVYDLMTVQIGVLPTFQTWPIKKKNFSNLNQLSQNKNSYPRTIRLN